MAWATYLRRQLSRLLSQRRATGAHGSMPKRLAIHESGYCLDGGTIALLATDEAGHERVIVLAQHWIPENQDEWIPGRLYFDDKLVPIRSGMEAELLELLRAADIGPNLPDDPPERRELPPRTLVLGDDIREVMTRGPKENLRALTADVLKFVESDEYVHLAKRLDQAP